MCLLRLASNSDLGILSIFKIVWLVSSFGSSPSARSFQGVIEQEAREDAMSAISPQRMKKQMLLLSVHTGTNILMHKMQDSRLMKLLKLSRALTQVAEISCTSIRGNLIGQTKQYPRCKNIINLDRKSEKSCDRKGGGWSDLLSYSEKSTSEKIIENTFE